jgi:hypothetical protein
MMNYQDAASALPRPLPRQLELTRGRPQADPATVRQPIWDDVNGRAHRVGGARPAPAWLASLCLVREQPGPFCTKWVLIVDVVNVGVARVVTGASDSVARGVSQGDLGVDRVRRNLAAWQ